LIYRESLVKAIVGLRRLEKILHLGIRDVKRRIAKAYDETTEEFGANEQNNEDTE
jgi:hypothetical protein